MANSENVPTSRGLSSSEILGPHNENSSIAMPIDKNGRISKGDLLRFMTDACRNSKLNGLKPSDGDKYKINGSPESWAHYFVWLCGKESDYKTKEKGDVGLFVGDSNGLFQLSPNDALNYKLQAHPFTLAQLQDPVFNATMTVKITEALVIKANSIRRGAGRYWGPIKRGHYP